MGDTFYRLTREILDGRKERERKGIPRTPEDIKYFPGVACTLLNVLISGSNKKGELLVIAKEVLDE